MAFVAAIQALIVRLNRHNHNSIFNFTKVALVDPGHCLENLNLFIVHNELVFGV